jgi:hypothetical protein
MAVIDSLVAKLSFDFDDKALEQFNKGMADAGKAVAAGAAAAAAAGAAIFAFTSKIAEQNDEMGKTAKIIGITAQSLNELGFVAELNGGSINSMNSALENVAKISSEAARGLGAGVEAFGLLGVSVTDANGDLKKADSLLLDVADAVAQLSSQSEKIELLNKLGIDSSMLLTLEQGSAAIRRQREEVKALGFVLDKDATQAAEKFNDEMLRVGTITKGVASAVGTKLMKQITPMIEAFVSWFKVNKDLIKQNLNSFFEKLTKIITVVFNIIRRVFNVVNTVAQAFGGWANAIGVVSAALLAMNIRILLIPALILAAGAAIFLLIEDLVAFANGADSQLGALAKKSDTFRIALEGIVEVMAMVGKGWNLIFTQGEAALDGLIFLIKDIGTTIFNSMIMPLNQAIKLLNNLPGVDIGTIEQAQTTGAYNAFSGGAVGSVSNSSTSNKVTVNINGGDTEAVKQAVNEALGADMKAAEQNLGTEVSF